MSHLAMRAVAVLAAALAPAEARRAGRGFLTISSDMQPQVVAQTLVKVEDEWRAEAASFAACNTSGAACDEAPKQFGKSCSTIVSAVVQASSGDRAVVQEYLADVCGEPQLDGWRRQLCEEFAGRVAGAMTEDVYKNREDLDAAALCHAFWLSFADSEHERVQRERDAQAAQLKADEAARAEARKVAAEERAEAERKAAADAAARAQRRAAEAQRRAAEAQRRAAEAALGKQAAQGKQSAQAGDEAAQSKQAAQAAQAAQSKQASDEADEAATRAAAEAEQEAAEVEKSVAEARASVEEAEGLQQTASAAPERPDEVGAPANSTAK